MKTRQYAIIVLFFISCGGLIFFSSFDQLSHYGAELAPVIKNNSHDLVEESFFKGVNYFSIANSKPFIDLFSTELSLSNTDGVVLGFGAKGIVYHYDKMGKVLEPVYFQSKNCRVLLKMKDLFLENDAQISSGQTSLKAHKIFVKANGEEIVAQDDVVTTTNILKTSDQVIINSNKANYRPKDRLFQYQDHVYGFIKRKKHYEESLAFSTDLLMLNTPQSLVSMKGNVTFKKENLEANANRGEVFLENYNKRLKYYALYDDVRLQERLINNGKTLVRKAFAEKLEGLISEKKIVLTGFPKVFQQKDVIKGNKIVIRENVETVEVDDANTSITIEHDKD